MKVWQGLQVRQLVQFPRTFSKAFSRTIPTPQNSTFTPSSPKTTLSIQNRTRSLVEALRTAQSEQSRQIRLEEFNDHLLRYQSVGKSQAIQEQAISTLLEIRKKGNKEVGREAQKALTLLGWADPVKGRGIKVLSIDGGGSRGLMAIEILKRIEDLCNKEIFELFDIICGASTGAILAFLLGIKKVPLEECEHTYKKLSLDIFEQNALIGTGKLFWSHAYYDTAKFEKILKKDGGDAKMIDSAKDTSIPKVAAVSTVVNHSLLIPFVFSNYTRPPGSVSQFPQSCKYRIWEALRASTAAPGFFEEFKLGKNIHQDGGLLTNNPSSIAIHEARRLWPDEPFQCIVSVGTGKYKGRSRPSTLEFSSLREKLLKVVASATDTEAVDTVLSDVLPPLSYFRFNPNMSADIPMDEGRTEMLEQIQFDARRYVAKEDENFKKCAEVLLQNKTLLDRLFMAKFKAWYRVS
ncbi:calcium-independent phospholipase A2-gamma-like [Acropora millepora]|uniref:calcium-independent phospholipase A2-gamma-like n=1 Tax=Acropora millepora TaxID=45264 RepID=UPI001CF26C2D|nr:calcium-independent phospholipase A2-gamma-like [Acropora millepora]